jgi:hypothetical protein
MLRGYCNLGRLLNAWRAAAVQLRGTKAGQHHELERVHAGWTFHHHESFVASPNEEQIHDNGDDNRHRREDHESTTNRPIMSGSSHEPGCPPSIEVGILFRLQQLKPSQAPRLW